MKKFISMVMAAAMVVSMVPATAFAASATATFKVVGDKEYTEEAAEANKTNKTTVAGPELQMKLTDLNAKTATVDEFEITLDFEGAEFAHNVTSIVDAKGWFDVTVTEIGEKDGDSITLVLKEKNKNLAEDDVVVIGLGQFGLLMTSDNAGAEATVEVSGDFGDSDAMVFAAVKEEGITVTLKDTADVAAEEVTCLEKALKIEADVDNFLAGQYIELKLSKGFEWDQAKTEKAIKADKKSAVTYVKSESEDNILVVSVNAKTKTITIPAADLWIDAVSADEGDVATITVKAKDNVKGSFKATGNVVDAAVVVGDGVVMSVDADEDVPTIWSGTDVTNTGLTSDDKHESLAVKFEETVKGAFDYKKSFTLTLTEGVFVTGVEVKPEKLDTFSTKANIEQAFKDAYEKGEYETFEFARKTFNETENAPFEFDVVFTLIAVPGFEGPVTLTLGGDAFENEVEVVIAEFVSPYKVEAAQNDVIIDYRHTAIESPIVVTEAEAGLWKDNNTKATAMEFEFKLDREIEFEDKATYTVNEDDSDMEIKAKGKNELGFVVDEESDDEAAVVTISDIELYMSRSQAAGAYDLEMGTSAGLAMMMYPLWTDESGADGNTYAVCDVADWDYDKKDGYTIEKSVVAPAFVNIVTAGRDQEAGVLLPTIEMTVGSTEMYVNGELVANEYGVAPINTGSRVLMPVRAISELLGIAKEDVMWTPETRTVTVLCDGKVITMKIGESVFYVNGAAIPATGEVLIQDGYTYIGARDLSIALGVDIQWDDVTKTVTIN